jgi:hypothetical protein
MEELVLQVLREGRENEVWMVQMVCLEKLVLLVRKEIAVHLEKLDLRDSKDFLAPKDLKANLVKLGSLDLLEKLVLLDHLALLVKEELLVTEEMPVLEEFLEKEVLKGLKDFLDHRAGKETKENLVDQVLPDFLVCLENLDLLG